MINMRSDDIASLLDSLGRDGAKCEEASFLAAIEWDECLAISGYCVGMALCKKSKDAARRQNECDAFFRFVADGYIEFGDLGPEFIGFMLRHVRDDRLTLTEQIRDLHGKLLEFDYKDALRR